jgi:DNA repair protein RecN (Recombination protein N)
VIRTLAIRNLAVIESVAVEFEPSFNILTGETGAGKSILVEAVGLLLGGRASQELVRTGADLATVEALFDVNGEELVVRREITAQGRSRAFVGGALATAATLKDLADRLVELHGQHEHQQLLDPEQHLPMLDAWAGLTAHQTRVAAAFASVRDLRARLDRTRMDARERAARLELVDFQLRELTNPDVRPGADEELATRREVLRNAEAIVELCTSSYGELYDAEHSVLSSLGHVWKHVSDLAAHDPQFAAYLDQRDAIKAQLEDLAFTLRDYAERVETSASELEAIEERVARLTHLKHKYGPTMEDLVARRDALTVEHRGLTGEGTSPEDLERQLESASAAYLAEARELSEARREAAVRFAAVLERELSELAMDRTRFEVRFAPPADPGGWSDRGVDAAEFYLSPNPGEEVRPLARIVSGGELSRVMLALKTLAAGNDTSKTLIFDEVDAGIGGRVATVVGEKLRALGSRFQVLCISHLPQIAAAASTHFHIEKTVKAARTITSVTRLADGDRVEEIARMLSGAAVGDQSRATARELLDAAKAKGERRSPTSAAKAKRLRSV